MALKKFVKDVLRVVYHNAPFKGLARLINSIIYVKNYISRKSSASRHAYRKVFKKTDSTLFRRCVEEIRLLEKLGLNAESIDAYVDVGANVGQNTLSARLFFDDKIPVYAFEPSSTALAKLKQLCQPLPGIVIHGCGVGNEDGYLQLNRSLSSVTSQASTYLDFSEQYKKEYEWARAPVKKERTEVRKLDTVLHSDLEKLNDIFLHIDVEGYDYFVLQGAAKSVLPRTKFIIVEITFNLFQGQGTFDQIYEFLKKDFDFRGFLDPLTLSSEGESMYQDAFFVRKDKAATSY